jgi:hypothetical protein
MCAWSKLFADRRQARCSEEEKAVLIGPICVHCESARSAREQSGSTGVKNWVWHVTRVTRHSATPSREQIYVILEEVHGE